MAYCYTPNGTDRNILAGFNQTKPKYKPCDLSQPVSMCCAIGVGGEYCTTEGFCKTGGNILWRESCTDSTWQSDACLKLFLNGTGYNNTAPRTSPYGDGPVTTDVQITNCTDGRWCFGTLNAGCCDNPNDGYFLVNGLAVTVQDYDAEASSSSSSSSATPTSLTTTSPSPSSSSSSSNSNPSQAASTSTPDNGGGGGGGGGGGLSTGAKAGIGVGVALGVLIAIGLMVWWFTRNRKQSRARHRADGLDSHSHNTDDKKGYNTGPAELGSRSNGMTRATAGVGAGAHQLHSDSRSELPHPQEPPLRHELPAEPIGGLSHKK